MIALPTRSAPAPVTVALALTGLAVAGVVLAQDWRVAAIGGAVAAAAILARYPFAGLLLLVALVFVGTPSLKITYLPGVVSQFFPAMLLIPPLFLGFLATAARDHRPWPPVRRERLTPLLPFVCAVTVLEVAGLAWAPNQDFALGQLATLAFDGLLFAAIVGACRDTARLRALLWAVVGSAVLVCGTMVCGALYDWAGTINLSPSAQLNFELFSEARWGRIGGLCSANQSGGFLVFATFLSLGLSRLYRRFARVGLCLLALMFLTFVVVSGSRGAILGFLGAAGLFMVLHATTRRRLVSRTALLVLALTVAILAGKPSFIDRMLVGFGYSGPLLFSEKKNSSSSAANVSGSGARLRMWKNALGVMADRPPLFLLGLGPGGFIWHTREPEVHSLWLAFFFDIGLLGGLTGLLGIAVLGTSVVAALRRAPPGPGRDLFIAVVVAAVAELGIHSLIDHDLTSPVSRFAWLYVAMLAAALQVARHQIEAASSRTPEVPHVALHPGGSPDCGPDRPFPVVEHHPEPSPALAAAARAASQGDGRPGTYRADHP